MRQFIFAVFFISACAHRPGQPTEMYVVHHLALDYTHCVLLPGGEWPAQCRAVESVNDSPDIYQALRPFSTPDAAAPEPPDISVAVRVLSNAARERACRDAAAPGERTVFFITNRAVFYIHVNACRGEQITASYSLLR